ncbi:uncharacterized protein LOC120085676 [Benincasa hispida]|uniref:uncharacterized protein LOC120085676 n=1 Tax=Benincasa hispida TaxID=102211 RepID=UPI001901AD2E|nr:uncharacterized protein LOC120085676 [Benincasa hispida]XP_038897738.1 uncharacterized protein LOC120085676 [Benincasa hispida]
MLYDDQWLTAAMADDTLVAELLFRLKQSQAVLPSKSPLPVTVPFTWGIRQPRSRMSTATATSTAAAAASAMATVAVRCGDVVLHRNNKDVDSTRCSPTTPLSWSGGASPSATLDGFEDSSRPATLSQAASRFKGAAGNESVAGNTTKRLRRKKTFAELKEEESMLLKEKLHLKMELATLRANFEEQRAKNESLKKMKVDFNLKYTEKFSTNSNMMPEESTSTLTHQRESSNIEKFSPTLPFTASGSGSFEAQSQKNCKSTEEDCGFLLPDLNMTPSED